MHTLWVFLSWDETPLKMTIVDSEKFFGLSGADLESLTGRPSASCPRHVGVAKLLQTKAIVSVSAKVNNQWFYWSWYPIVPVQALGRTTAEVYHDAVKCTLASLRVSDHSASFLYNSIHVAKDREGSGIRMLRGLRAEIEASGAQPAASLVEEDCDVHVKCSNRQHTFTSCKGLVTKVIHFMLSLNFSNHRKLFRTAAQRVLLRAADVAEAMPPAWGFRVNFTMLDCILPDRPENRSRRASLLYHFNWTWGGEEIALRRVAGETMSDFKSRLADGAVDSLLGSTIDSFPGNKWIKAEEAPAWILLLAVTGMLCPTYREFCILVGHTGAGCAELDDADMPALLDDAPNPELKATSVRLTDYVLYCKNVPNNLLKTLWLQ